MRDAPRWFARIDWDWGLVAIATAAVALRLPHLTDRSLWYDEASSWQTARFSFPEMIRSLRLNVHLPLYYTMLKGWMAVWGDSAASLRGFSITFAALTVFLMGLFGRELYRASAAGDEHDEAGARRFGWMVAGLVAVSPFQVLQTIEARMYALGTAAVAASSWLLLRILREGGPRSLWWAYWAACAVLLHTHHYGLFSVAAQFLFLALYAAWLLGLGERDEARSLARGASAVAAGLALVYLPALLLLRGQYGRVREEYWIPELTLRYFWGTFSQLLVPTHGFDSLIGGRAVFAVAVLAGVVVAIGGRRGDGLVLASAIVPMVGAAAASAIKPIWHHRYFLFAHLFLLSAVALASWKLTRRATVARGALVVLLYGVMAGAAYDFWKNLDLPGGSGVRGAAEAIMARRVDDELVLVMNFHHYFPLKYYLGRRARVRLLRPEPGLYWGPHLIRPDDLIGPEQLEGELRRGLWVVDGGDGPAVLPTTAPVAILETHRFHYYHSIHRRMFVEHDRLAAGPNGKEGSSP